MLAPLVRTRPQQRGKEEAGKERLKGRRLKAKKD